MTGQLEPTNSAYAVAKIAGVEMCWSYNQQYGTSFIPVMPTNLYGPGDNFDLETSHVLPALMRKFHEAAEQKAETVTIWGTGTPRREFLHVDDLATACVHLLETDDTKLSLKHSPLYNIGTGKDISILELAELIARIVGFQGQILNDLSKPDGTPQKRLDVSRISDLDWSSKIELEQGIEALYEWYTDQKNGNI